MLAIYLFGLLKKWFGRVQQRIKNEAYFKLPNGVRKIIWKMGEMTEVIKYTS